jgi:hypothetical protein
VLPACAYIEGRLKTCEDVRIDLVNSQQTIAAVNIAGPEESFGPGNLLASGAARSLVLCLERGDRKQFRAGVDGDTVGTINCVASRGTYEGQPVPRVVWTLQGLTCEDW